MTWRWRLSSIALGLLAVIVVVAMGCWGVVAGQAASQRVFPGVFVNEQHLGGLTREEAESQLLRLEDQLLNRQVELSLDGRSWRVSLMQLGLAIDIETMTDQALQAGRNGLVFQQWIERRRIRSEGKYIPLKASLDREKLRYVVQQNIPDLLRQPRDAGFRVTEDDKVIIVPHQDGRDVDIQRLYDAVVASLSWTYPHPIEVPQRIVRPKHRTQDIENMGLTGLLASYSTSFNPSLVDRSYNVTVAAAAMDNLLVKPGQVVSFNDTVGPRDSTTGYREAPIIIDNQFEDGMGGGVCQVASTLYNAVLLANLEIVERSNHSLPVTYVPIGRDATVVYGAVDFKFRNNTEHYVFIKTSVTPGRLTFKVFGDTARQKKVEIHTWITDTFEPAVVRETDPNLVVGEEVVKQKGLKGYRTRGERWVWQSDGRVIKEPLMSSNYRALKRIIAVGTKEAPATITPIDDPNEDTSSSQQPELSALPAV